MKRDFSPDRLDVAGFAAAAETLTGSDPVTRYARLADELADTPTDEPVVWMANGEERVGADGAPAPWLHLAADATVALVCQRCLTPVATPLGVDRWFRFVADEATAEAEDEQSNEEVLAVSREFDLRALIEDELLMALPLTPVHAVCPEPVKLSAVDADFEAGDSGRPNPFAVLGTLRRDPPGKA